MKLMLKIFTKKTAIVIVVLTLLNACNSEEFQNLNVNPTAPQELDWRYLFTKGSLQVAESQHVNWRANIGYSATFVQQLASTSFGGVAGTGDKYFRSDDLSGSYFTFVYSRALKELAEVLRQTGPEGKNPEQTNLNATARIMYIVAMHRMTDLYGNVPYGEANRGIEGIFMPGYDHQRDIYTDMLEKLDNAASTMSESADALGNSDLLYGGSISQWKKFAYSLMLRLAMRVSNVDPGMSQTYVQKAITGGVFMSNEDMAYIQMATGPDESYNPNGISRVLGLSGNEDALLSKTLVDWLKSNNDPRLMIYSGGIGLISGTRNTDPAAQKGLPNGSDGASLKLLEGTTEPVITELTYSRVNPKLLDNDDAYLFQTYAEVELLLAEAALKGWGGMTVANAAAHYNAAVKAAMQMWTLFDESLSVSDTDVSNYLSAHPFVEANGYEMIGEQYWAAQFLNWYEAYANWRRTGYPELVPVNYAGNASNGQIPRKFEYPSSEIATNKNFQTGATLPNSFVTKVWWDVQ